MKIQAIYQAIVCVKDNNYVHAHEVLVGVTPEELRIKILHWVKKEYTDFFSLESMSLDFLVQDDEDEDNLTNKIWEKKELLEKENEGMTFDFFIMDEHHAYIDELGIKEIKVA